jgi:hypothetical protein
VTLLPIDFYKVLTAISRVLFVFVVPSHNRRSIAHVNVRSHPTAAWTARNTSAGRGRGTPRRASSSGSVAGSTNRILGGSQQIGLDDVLTAPRSSRPNPTLNV